MSPADILAMDGKALADVLGLTNEPAKADAPPQRPAQMAAKKPATKTDRQQRPMDLLRVIAASGGINRDAAKAMGVDPAEFTRRAGFHYVFRKSGGMTIDQLREFMQQENYLPRDPEDGTPLVDDNDAFDLFDRAFRGGEDIFSDDQADQVAAWRSQQQDDAQAFEAETEAGIAADLGFASAEDMHAAIADAEARDVAHEGDFDASDIGTALTLDELSDRAADAEIDAFDVARFSSETDAAYAARLWDYIKQKEAENGNERSATETAVHQRLRAEDGGEAEGGSRVEETRADLFAAPTRQEEIAAARSAEDAQRDGKTGTGRTDMLAGEGELFAGERPAQADIEQDSNTVETGTIREQDVAAYGDTRPLQAGTQRGAVGTANHVASGRRAGSDVSGGQLDLFVATRGQAEPGQGNPPVVKVDRKQLAQRVGLVQTGQFRSGVERVTSLSDAAHILAPIRKSAQERLAVLAMDKDGKPLAVLQHTVGLIDSSNVSTGTIFGAIASIPGAARIVWAHNHPSANQTPSQGDRGVDAKMEALFKDSGISIDGAIIFQPGRNTFTHFSSKYSAADGKLTERITPARRTGTVPQVERQLVKAQPVEGRHALTNPSAAKSYIERLRQDHEAGLVLLNSRHEVVGVLPFDPKQTEKLRTGDVTTSHAQVAAAIHEANAGAAMVFGDKSAERGIKNMGRAASAADIHVLDTFLIEDGKATSEIGRVGSSGTGGVLESYVTEASPADLTGPEREAYERWQNERDGRAAGERQRQAAAERSQLEGDADADRLGLREAVDKVLSNASITGHFLRDRDGLHGLVVADAIAKNRDQIEARAKQGGTGQLHGLYVPAGKSVSGKPFYVVFTGAANTPQLAALVAAHEVAGHYGLRTLLGKELDAALNIALQNPTVKAVAEKIAEQRKFKPGQRLLAAEEALAELNAAIRTGDFGIIQRRYGIGVPEGMRRESLVKSIANFLKRLRALFAKQGIAFTDEQVRSLLDAAHQATQRSDMTASVAAANGALEQVVFDPAPEHQLEAVRSLSERMRKTNGSSAARSEANAFIGEQLRNLETGRAASVSGESFGKMMSASAWQKSVSPEAHYRALGNLDHLFEVATLRLTRKPNEGGSDIVAMHHFDAPLPVGGEVLRAKMLVKEFSDRNKGGRIYSVQSVEVDAGVVGQDPDVSGRFRRDGDTTTSQPPPGVNDRFAQLVEAVKTGREADSDSILESAESTPAQDAKRAILKQGFVTPKDKDGKAALYSRRGWDETFPDAVLAHRPGVLAAHPDYQAAKSGDNEAGLRLARDIVTPEYVQAIRTALPAGSKPTIVPVLAIEAAGNNRIPAMSAKVLAEALGLEATADILQSKKVGRGGSDGMHRIANQPTFTGDVKQDGEYIILDDTLTQGGTLAALKTHIEDNGGKVLLASALTGKQYSAKIGIGKEQLANLRERYGSLESWWRDTFGYGFEGFTESEARFILKLKGRPGPDALRDRILAAGVQGQHGLGGRDDPQRKDQRSVAAADNTPRAGLAYAQAQDIKAKLTRHWGDNAPRIVLVESAEELQRAAGLPRSYLNDPDFYRAEGLYNGEPVVYLNLAAISTEKRFGEVLAHEALGHYGVEQVVGAKEWGSIRGAIIRHRDTGSGSPSVRKAIAHVRKTQEARQPLDDDTFAREVVAVMAEQGAKNGLVRRVVAAVRKFLRRIMPDMQWTDADIVRLLADANSFLHAGTPAHARQAEMRQRMAFSNQAEPLHSTLLQAEDATKGAPKKGNRLRHLKSEGPDTRGPSRIQFPAGARGQSLAGERVLSDDDLRKFRSDQRSKNLGKPILFSKAPTKAIDDIESAIRAAPNSLYTVEAAEFNEKSPAATWVAASAESDGISLTSTRSAGDVLSLAQRVQGFKAMPNLCAI